MELRADAHFSTSRSLGWSSIPWVIVGGIASTLLALAGVWWADQHELNALGWHGNYVIPGGTIIVGLIAASGYGLAAYLSGTRVTGLRLVTVLALLTVSYGLAQYFDFQLLFRDGAVREDGSPLGFFTYFDIATRSIHWEAARADEANGSPLGMWGYALRTLELVGFVGGGAIIPFVRRKVPAGQRAGP
jgi:hypothetical protein